MTARRAIRARRVSDALRDALIARRNILRAMLSFDPDRELREQIEEIDRRLAALDGKRNKRRAS